MTLADEKQPWTLICGLLCIALGSLVCAGWATGNFTLVQILPRFAGMQFNTAMGFLLSGAALVAMGLTRQRVAQWAASAVLLLGVFNVAQYAFGWESPIDSLFIDPDNPVALNNSYPGRMSSNTALAFSLSGLTILVMYMRPFRWKLVFIVALNCFVLVLAFAVLLAYAAGFFWRDYWHLFTQMAVHTALGFMLIGCGLASAVAAAVRENRNTRSHALFGSFHPWLILVLGLSLAICSGYLASVIVMQKAEARFQAINYRIVAAIEERIVALEQVLFGGRGLIAASETVDREEWREYVRAQQLEKRYPGIQGVGFAERVTHAGKERFEQRLREEGYTDFAVVPPGVRSVYYPILYLEPFDDRNRRAFGYDMFAQSVRREAMERARDTGRIAASGRVRLVQETATDIQAGFLMYVPVYDSLEIPHTLQQKREQIRGFVYSPFRVTNLMRGIGGLDHPGVLLRIYDGARVDNQSLLYDSGGDYADTPADTKQDFRLTVQLDVAGRQWSLVFSDLPPFRAAIPLYLPRLVLLAGIVITLLLFGVLWSLSTTRARALELAEKMTARVRESETRFRRLVQESRGLVCSHDMQGNLLYVNPAAADSLGYSSGELAGMNLRELLIPEVREKLDGYLADFKDNRHVSGSMILRTRTGGNRIWDYDNVRLWDEKNGFYVLGHAQDTTEFRQAHHELKEAHDKMRDLATRDPLTGLCNRSLLVEHMEQLTAHARRKNTVMAVCFIDLNGFKEVNDTLGHAAGDELLMHTAEILKSVVRQSDVVARLGGDEFVLVLNDLADLKEAGLVADKISEQLSRPVQVSGHKVQVSSSIGIAGFPQDAGHPDAVIEFADAAMYRCKREKTRYAFYSRRSEGSP